MKTLRVLIVEDSEYDAELLVRELQRAQYEIVFDRVETAEAMGVALARKAWDMVIADYVMPRFSGLEALDVLHESGIDIPFIIVSGKIGEEVAVEATKAGAHDYIMKNNLMRLVPAIERELRDAEVRRERRRAGDQLRKAYEQLEIRVAARTAELTAANEELRREIAERKQVEEALRRSREDLNRAQAVAHTGSWQLDVRRNELLWSDEVYRIFGIPNGTPMTYEAFLATIHPDDRRHVDEKWTAAIHGEPFDIEHRIVVGENVKWVRERAELEFDEQGYLKGGFGTVQDVTERRRAEQELLESEAKYSALVEQANDGVFIVQEETIEFANRALAEMSGCTVEQLTGSCVFDLIAPESREEIIGLFRRLMSGEETSKLHEVKGMSKDGTLKDIEISAVLIDYHGKPAAVGIVRDITERKELEARRLTASKLKSIGVLAGGIAHDFNNILTAILGNLSLAKMYARPSDKIFERLAEAEKASLRAKHLTQQMLVFSKGGTPVKRIVSLADLVRDAAVFAVHGSKTTTRIDIAGDLWPAEVDEGQIGQVISNLVLNADQAMPEGGLITVQAENVTVKEGDIRSLTAGNYVKLTVKDQGTGIPEEYLTRIFDPYFTTKEKGSGLGLTTVYSIIKNHDGHIHVESKVDVGTTVYVYLPASREAVAADEIDEGSLSETPLPGKGRVLVMDDEEMVREVAGEILTHMGYEVDYAKDGTEAIAVYQDAKWMGRPFDILIMDLTIPGGMGGKEAVKKLLEIDPEAKVIVSSGYSSDPIMSDFAKYGFIGVIAKPYRIEDLSAVLYRIMATKPIRNRQAG